MHVLIINLLRLGDIVISLPLIKNLKFTFDEKIKISVLIREEFKDIFRCVPYVEKVYSYKNKISLLRNAKEFKKYDYVIYVMEKDLFRLKFFSFLKIQRRIGYSLSKNSNHYLTDIVKYDEKFEGLELLFLKLLKPLGILNYKFFIPELYPLEKDSKKFRDLLPKNIPKFVIHLDTYAPSRKWPYFMELINFINQEMNGNVCVILTGRNKNNLDFNLKSNFENILDLRGKTSLSELTALFKLADLVIGCDTGALHIARAVGTKTIIIYGPEDPKITVPSTNLIKIYSNLDIECKKNNDYFEISFCNVKRCKKYACTNLKCLKSISFYEVWTRIKQFYGNQK